MARAEEGKAPCEIWAAKPTRDGGGGVSVGDDVVPGLPELAAEARRGEGLGPRGFQGHGHGRQQGLLGLDGHERAVARGVERREEQRFHIGVGEQRQLDEDGAQRARASALEPGTTGSLTPPSSSLESSMTPRRRRSSSMVGIDACFSSSECLFIVFFIFY
jgi:hypothetical protein